MNNSYYEPRDLKKFEDIDEFGPELAEKFLIIMVQYSRREL